MKKLVLSICLMLIAGMGFGQAPDWDWVRTGVGWPNNNSYSICSDIDENVYITGYFTSSIIVFEADTLINTTLTSHADVFIAKYNKIGNVLWAKKQGGILWDEGLSICVDSTGNVYMTGHFNSPFITFGNDTLINVGNADIFIAKYDSDGNVIWARSAGGTASDAGNSICTDALGNAIITGAFRSPYIIFDGDTLVNADSTGNTDDMFIVKYDSSGNVIWAKAAGNINQDRGQSITIDISNNIYVTGRFESPAIVFGNDTLACIGNADIFIVKYDSAGSVQWAKSGGGTDYNISQGICADENGNIFVTGYFTSPTLSFGTTTLTIAGGMDVFIVKYNSSGDVIWAKRDGGAASSENSLGICVDKYGNSYLTGIFDGLTTTFGSTVLTSAGWHDFFVVKYDSSGNFVWAKSAGGLCSNDRSYGISVGTGGNLYVTGNLDGTPIFFDTDTIGGPGVFVAKIENAVGIHEILANAGLSFIIYPNPTSDQLTIESTEKSEIEVLNIQGQVIKTFATKENATTIDVSAFARGMYFVKVKTENGFVVKKFIKE